MTARWLIAASELGITPTGEVIPGGVQRAGRCFCRALASAPGVRHLVILSLMDSPDSVPYLQRMVRLYAPPELTVTVKAWGGSRVRMARAVWASMLKVDRVLYLHGYQSVLGLLPGHRPYTLLGHGAELFEPLSRLRRYALYRAERIITVSAHTAHAAKRLNPSLSQPRVVPLCLEPPLYTQESSDPAFDFPYHPTERAPAALIVGTMARWSRFTKGHRDLIAAWEHVTARIPEAELWIVGGGEAESELRAQAAALSDSTRDHVRFWGRLSDTALDDLWRRARLFALPSNREGFGLVYLEAMRAGLPCVASDADAGREVVIDGQTGLVVPQRAEPIAEAVIRLLSEPDLAARMGAAGRIRCRDHFQFESFRLRALSALGLESHRKIN